MGALISPLKISVPFNRWSWKLVGILRAHEMVQTIVLKELTQYCSSRAIMYYEYDMIYVALSFAFLFLIQLKNQALSLVVRAFVVL